MDNGKHYRKPTGKDLQVVNLLENTSCSRYRPKKLLLKAYRDLFLNSQVSGCLFRGHCVPSPQSVWFLNSSQYKRRNLFFY